MRTLTLDYLFNTLIGDYPYLLRDLDKTYGGPEYKKKKRVNGRAALFLILEFLSSYKQSTCKEIAKYKILKMEKLAKKKSVADGLRKFIRGNLIPLRILTEDGFKTNYKDEQAYSLTPFGILYSIHLFSKKKNISDIINNLSIEYKDVLPYVFGQFSLFKRMLGKNFLETINLQSIADGRLFPTIISRGAIDALGNFVNLAQGLWMKDITNYYEDRWVDQISICVYNNIMSNIYSDAEIEFIARGQKGNLNDLIKKRITKFWEIINRDDPEITKWYRQYIEEAILANQDSARGLREAHDWLK